METQQANKSFCSLLVASGLLSETTIRAVLTQFPQRTESTTAITALFIEQGLLTEWQAGKLLQGKHRGFFLGPYKLLRHLAKGGMSTLYVAEHTGTSEIHALKVLPPSKAEASDASYLPRFLREARLASQLNHENVIQVHEILSTKDEQSNVHFMSMELLEGTDLYNKVATSGPLSIRCAANVIQQAARGLEYAHSQGLIHRDVKPGNLFETVDGTVKLLDLGLAGLAEDVGHENLTRDFNERVLGTADYLAPEQAVDSHRADSRADIYALGCTMYYVLTGRPPFVDCTLPQRILAHQTKAPQDVRSIRSDIPQAVYDLLQKMLVKQRAKRIQTAADVADILEAWQASVIDDPTFDLPPALLEGGAELKARRLQRIQPADKEVSTDTPTDSIRAAETQTSPFGKTSNPGKSRPHPPTYTAEFEEFLQMLDAESGAQGVMHSDVLERRRREFSVVAEPTQSVLAGYADGQNKASAYSVSPATKAQMLKVVTMMSGAIVCAAIIGFAASASTEWARRLLQTCVELW